MTSNILVPIVLAYCVVTICRCIMLIVTVISMTYQGEHLNRLALWIVESMNWPIDETIINISSATVVILNYFIPSFSNLLALFREYFLNFKTLAYLTCYCLLYKFMNGRNTSDTNSSTDATPDISPFVTETSTGRESAKVAKVITEYFESALSSLLNSALFTDLVYVVFQILLTCICAAVVGYIWTDVAGALNSL